MKCFVVADVHSFYDKMMEALDKEKFDKDNPQHVFISLGDLLDRGDKPKECLQFVNSLERKILIRGNHEDLLQSMLDRGCFLAHDIHNGTYGTVQILSGITDYSEESEVKAIEFVKNYDLWNNYYNATINYFETKKFIGVHGWIPRGVNWREDPDSLWEDARWLNGMKQWYKGDDIKDKTILCGHYHTSWGHHFIHNKGPEFNEDLKDLKQKYPGSKFEQAHFEPFKDRGIIALDGCTAYSGIVNCFTFTCSKEQLKSYL